MKLRVERRGGLVGKLAVGEKDLSDLTPVQRQALEQLTSAPPIARRSPGADRFQYKVQLLDDRVRQEFEVPEDAMPEELASIVKVQP